VCFCKSSSLVLELKIKTNAYREISVGLCRNVCNVFFLTSLPWEGYRVNYSINSAEGWMTVSS